MKKALLIILAILVLIILVIYFFPRPQASFDELFSRVDEETVKSLQTFRQETPVKQLDVNGRLWEYVVVGDGPETILFLHGMTGASDIWWQQINALAPDYQVIALTYPPAAGLEAMADGVIAILDAEQVDEVNVVGSSLGGYLAQYLVANYPERVKRAVFANTFPPNDIIAEKNKTIGSLLPFLPEWAVMSVLKKSTEENIYPAAGHSELVRAYMLEQANGRMSKSQFLARFQSVIDPFTPPNPEQSGIPVMIIEADNDPLVEETLREMLKETYPTAVVQTLHNVGHFSYLNEPEMYTDLLREFFTESE